MVPKYNITINDVNTFIDSLKEIPINFSNNALILPNDITVYRIVSGNTTNSISKGNLIKKFKSAKEAAEELNGNYKFIRSCAAGYKKSAYGYIWKYE